MTIKLLTSATKLGSKGDVVEVGANLGIGLVKRKQAIYHNKKVEVTNKDSKEKEYIEVSEPLESKTVKELQEIAKEKGISYSGLRKDDLIKELKEPDTTKEDKSEYKTK